MSKPPENILSRKEALSAIPVRNPSVTEEWISDNIVQLTYPLPSGRVVAAIISIFGKKRDFLSRFTKLELDVQGSRVWQAIDGKRSVRKISRDFASETNVDKSDSQLAVSIFLRQLGRRGIIGLKSATQA